MANAPDPPSLPVAPGAQDSTALKRKPLAYDSDEDVADWIRVIREVRSAASVKKEQEWMVGGAKAI